MKRFFFSKNSCLNLDLQWTVQFDSKNQFLQEAENRGLKMLGEMCKLNPLA